MPNGKGSKVKYFFYPIRELEHSGVSASAFSGYKFHYCSTVFKSSRKRQIRRLRLAIQCVYIGTPVNNDAWVTKRQWAALPLHQSQYININVSLSLYNYQFILGNVQLSMYRYQCIIFSVSYQIYHYKCIIINISLSMYPYQYILINVSLAMYPYQCIIVNV